MGFFQFTKFRHRKLFLRTDTLISSEYQHMVYAHDLNVQHDREERGGEGPECHLFSVDTIHRLNE